MAKCFCKARNHAQCFTLNTSGKYHCCFRIKDLNAVSNSKFFHVSIETRPFSETFKVRDRDIGIARPRRDTQKRFSRPRHVSRHPVLINYVAYLQFKIGFTSSYDDAYYSYSRPNNRFFSEHDKYSAVAYVWAKQWANLVGIFFQYLLFQHTQKGAHKDTCDVQYETTI